MTMIEKLVTLQGVDARIKGMEQEMRDIPARKEAEISRLHEHQEALKKAQEAVKAGEAKIKEVQLEVEACEAKVTKLRQQQLEIKTNKEFKALESEIAGVGKQVASLEDRELELMEDLEKVKSEVRQRTADLKAEESSVDVDIKALDERAAGIEARIRDEKGLREAAAREVDPEWLPRYETVLSRRDDAVVRLVDGVCGGCHMQVPPAVMHDTKRHDCLTPCPFCGRLLY